MNDGSWSSSSGEREMNCDILNWALRGCLWCLIVPLECGDVVWLADVRKQEGLEGLVRSTRSRSRSRESERARERERVKRKELR